MKENLTKAQPEGYPLAQGIPVDIPGKVWFSYIALLP